MAEYSKRGTLKMNGIPLAEVQEFQEQISSNDKEVLTMAKGMAGHSDGAEMVKLSWKNAVPFAGFEVDFADFAVQHKTATFSIRLANKETTYQGRFTEVNASSSVENPNGVDCSVSASIVSRVAV